MKILLYLLITLFVVVGIVIVTGMALPKAHVASVRAHYKQQPQALYNTIVDVTQGPQWRTGLKRVSVLEQQPLKWQEEASWGNLTMVMDEATSPRKVVSRIADTSQGFGGTWTYEIAPDANGSIVTITENGEVYNPMFRFMSKFVFGHHKSLEVYARDLGRRFKEDVTPERVAQ